MSVLSAEFKYELGDWVNYRCPPGRSFCHPYLIIERHIGQCDDRIRRTYVVRSHLLGDYPGTQVQESEIEPYVPEEG